MIHMFYLTEAHMQYYIAAGQWGAMQNNDRLVYTNANLERFPAS